MNFFFIKVGKKNVKIDLDEVVYIEGKPNFSKFWVSGKKFYTSNKIIKDLQQLLPPDQFCRIHKTYIISLKNLQAYDNHSVYFKEIELPIGEAYKPGFLSTIQPAKLERRRGPRGQEKQNNRINAVSGKVRTIGKTARKIEDASLRVATS